MYTKALKPEQSSGDPVDECNGDFSTTIALSHRQLHGVH
jgi:hypothetical protein